MRCSREAGSRVSGILGDAPRHPESQPNDPEVQLQEKACPCSLATLPDNRVWFGIPLGVPPVRCSPIAHVVESSPGFLRCVSRSLLRLVCAPKVRPARVFCRSRVNWRGAGIRPRCSFRPTTRRRIQASGGSRRQPWLGPEAGQGKGRSGPRTLRSSTSPCRSSVSGGACFHLRVGERLFRAVREWRPDVVHVFKPKGPSGLVGAAFWVTRRLTAGDPRARVSLAKHPPVVIDSDDWEGAGGWNDDPRAGYSALQRRFFAWQERFGLSHADAWTVTSECLRAARPRIWRPPGSHFHVT